jgi:hypothetical protein
MLTTISVLPRSRSCLRCPEVFCYLFGGDRYWARQECIRRPSAQNQSGWQLMRWLSPPLNVAACLERVRYSSLRLLRNSALSSALSKSASRSWLLFEITEDYLKTPLCLKWEAAQVVDIQPPTVTASAAFIQSPASAFRAGVGGHEFLIFRLHGVALRFLYRRSRLLITPSIWLL